MIEYKLDTNNIKHVILDLISNLIVNMIVIILATKIFKNIYVDNIWYTLLVSILLLILNKCLKPFLKIIMLPINIYTMGITYPFINVFILNLISLILDKHFVLSGWFGTFFISIFISIMTLIIDSLIGREIRRVSL